VIRRGRAALTATLLVVSACSAPATAPAPADPTVTHATPAPTPRAPRTATANPKLIGRLNPDVTPATIHATICVSGWTATVRPPEKYTSRLKRRQLPAGALLRDYEEDHLMPLELGGAPRDVANLNPVPITRAHADDRWENRLHRAVCAGTLTLAAARRRISEIKQGEDRPVTS
jgi:hypothetical protein